MEDFYKKYIRCLDLASELMGYIFEELEDSPKSWSELEIRLQDMEIYKEYMSILGYIKNFANDLVNRRIKIKNGKVVCSKISELWNRVVDKLEDRDPLLIIDWYNRHIKDVVILSDYLKRDPVLRLIKLLVKITRYISSYSTKGALKLPDRVLEWVERNKGVAHLEYLKRYNSKKDLYM